MFKINIFTYINININIYIYNKLKNYILIKKISVDRIFFQAS